MGGDSVAEIRHIPETSATECEYHGDLHDDNIIVRRHGLSFDLKLVDMFPWGATRPG